jgi:CIC family chloride channel protein
MDKWFPAAHFIPAAFAVVGMGAVFAGTARVPLATLIMVAEMTGGYGLIVPAMLASSLSFMVQRSLSVRARYPRLYEAQVEARLDSPVHHLRLVQGAFRILETAATQDLQGVSVPDLNNLLRFGQSIGIHGGKGRIFTFTLASPDSPLVGRAATEVNGVKGGLVLIAVVRGEEVLPPGHGGLLEQGDTLIIAAGDQAYAEFMQSFGQSIPGES